MFELNLRCPTKCYDDINTMLCANCSGDILDDIANAPNKDSERALTDEKEMARTRTLQNPMSKLHRIQFIVNVIIDRMLFLDYILVSIPAEKKKLKGRVVGPWELERVKCQTLVENVFWFLEHILSGTMRDRVVAPGLRLGDLSTEVSSRTCPGFPSRCGDYHNLLPLLKTRRP